MQIDLRVTSDLETVRHVGRGLRELCLSSYIGSKTADEIELAVVEALNNAVKHAYGFRPGHDIYVEFTYTDNTVTLRLHDYGESCPSWLYESERTITFDPEDVSTWPEGGMGIALIQTCMDQVTYVAGETENVLTLSKSVEPALHAKTDS